jgi:hypothetical protein
VTNLEFPSQPPGVPWKKGHLTTVTTSPRHADTPGQMGRGRVCGGQALSSNLFLGSGSSGTRGLEVSLEPGTCAFLVSVGDQGELVQGPAQGSWNTKPFKFLPIHQSLAGMGRTLKGLQAGLGNPSEAT